ncbi:MAG: class II poly(R)-hydroxyalkanoic acid synthase, partial [Betaproteobacteria bacterium]|nr:class II poly(R)-hydroxyalkanoic acid synthase [Betaproteobacteria bacterium]
MNDAEIRDQAAGSTLAANPLVGVRERDIAAAARMLAEQIARHPLLAARHSLALLGELAAVVTGRSSLAPDPKDRRFADPAWRESFGYRALSQGYLAWAQALNRFVDEVRLDGRDTERARFVVSLLVDALAPTN